LGEHTLSSALFEYADATNLFEIIGLDVPSAVLESFRPFILRVGTDRHDLPASHWTKALLSLALGERGGWAPIAGLLPTQNISFVPRKTFELNMQELIAYLGSALLANAALDDVLPAWHSFMAAAVPLKDARQIDDQVVLWAGRIIFHHIGKQPVGAVGELIYNEIDSFI